MAGEKGQRMKRFIIKPYPWFVVGVMLGAATIIYAQEPNTGQTVSNLLTATILCLLVAVLLQIVRHERSSSRH